jgi:hypothetical protein
MNLSGSQVNDVKRIRIDAYTHPEVNCPDFVVDPSEYEAAVHTGAGVFEITVSWDDGDERKMYIPIEGSCDKNYNADSSGTELTWKQLSQNYYYDVNHQYPNSNDVDDVNFSNRLRFIAPGDLS